MRGRWVRILLLAALALGTTLWRPMDQLPAPAAYPTAKPVIYLYPPEATDVRVELEFDGELTYTYPAYRNAWSVIAYPDGRLIDIADGSEHYYLFWEGVTDHRWDLSSGFVVPGGQTEAFLRRTLSGMGLMPREYNDFIVYWAPQMQDNPYNLISFSGMEEYEAVARLTVSPRPDSILRVHMAWAPLEEPVDIPPQELSTLSHSGFVVVEWGGTRCDYSA